MPSTFKLLLEKAEQERVAQVGASGAGQAKCTGWEGWLARSEVAMHEVGPPLSLFARARTNGWSDSWWGKSGRELSPRLFIDGVLIGVGRAKLCSVYRAIVDWSPPNNKMQA